MRVAVSAVGGGIGQSILKCLKGTRYKTIAIDPSYKAMGLYYADKGYIGNMVNDDCFVDRLLEICKKEKCSFIFPGLDAELMPLSQNSDLFKINNITPIVSKKHVIQLSNDKQLLQEFLRDEGLPYIKSATSLEQAIDLKIEYPVIFKPRLDGCRSKGVEFFDNEESLRKHVSGYSGEYVIQEYIDGDEYTCGSVTFDQDVKGIIVMQRELREGDTYKAFVSKDQMILEFLENLLPKINPFGPCNVQLRMRRGIPYAFEINARCSGTTAARALAGFNEPKIICDYLSGRKIVKVRQDDIKEIAILRYWSEHVVQRRDMERIKNAYFIDRSHWFSWPGFQLPGRSRITPYTYKI